MAQVEVRIREMESRDVDITKEMIKSGLREHLVASMNLQMINVTIWEFCIGCSILLSIAIATTASFYFLVLVYSGCIACLFYVAGLLFLNFVVVREEISDIDKDFLKVYHKFWVAEISSNGEWEIVGSVALRECDDSEDMLEVKRMSVRKDYRRRGIAELLMNRVIGYSSKNGMRKLFLQSTSVQKAALRLYAKLGFKNTKIIRWKYVFGLITITVPELVLQLRQ